MLLAFECFKSRLDVAHGMCMGSGRRRERRSRWHKPTAGALAHEPDVAGALSQIWAQGTLTGHIFGPSTTEDEARED
jgi:hypothetical protein